MADRRRPGVWPALFAVGLLLASGAAPAQEKPDQSELDKAKAEQAVEAQKAEKLAGEAAQQRRALTRESKALAALAANIRNSEAALFRLEDAQAEKQAALAAGSVRIRENRARFATTLSALAGIRAAHPLTAVARPGELRAAALSASALAGLRAGLQARATALAEAQAQWQADQAALAALASRAAEVLAALQADDRALNERIARKRRTLARVQAAGADSRARADALADKVRTLAGLVNQVRRLEKLTPVSGAGAVAQRVRFGALKGRLPLPVALPVGRGIAFSGDGVYLQTRPGAIVTAPHDAIVRFAGPFYAWDGLLVLDPGDGYHLIVAGLSGIDVVAGQWLLAGEPVGRAALGDGGRGRIYLELRRDGAPIDPAPWLAQQQGRSGG